ncbi:hypothetical protein EK21DRAFT_99576 [Setomelanomma holmii]|uniref:Rhodopsin domain-containing protein n=1 Tax=Setomelanomma holmii TaxID=210430 RepID=A0A9P4HAY9_9PLEO|nr:hypothetical protein EK21DRAFT_99576 [Setomelanomma holmii]
MTSPFSLEELAYLEAHKHDTRVDEIHWVYIVPIVAATISTALRFWAKRLGRNGITLDDYLILLATFCLIGQCASGLGYGPPHGMGRHVIVVSAYDQMMVRKGDYIFSHFYDFALVFVKLGILAFYYRVFVHHVFRTVVLATATFVIAWGIGITVTLFLACRPLNAYWDVNVPGQCLKIVTFTYFTNISNLITDIWIFLMPVPMIWHLQLQTKKKLLLSLIFCIGLATCVVSSIRLTVVLGRGSPDFTWYYVPLGAYSVFEPLGGILCTNLPIIWHMLRKRRALNRDHDGFMKTHQSSTPTTGSDSRRSRIMRGLGITTADRTQNDSATRTVMDGTGAPGTTDFHRLESIESQKPDPNIWTTVERMDTDGSGAGSSEEVQLKPGMKKTVWNVRR